MSQLSLINTLFPREIRAAIFEALFETKPKEGLFLRQICKLWQSEVDQIVLRSFWNQGKKVPSNPHISASDVMRNVEIQFRNQEEVLPDTFCCLDLFKAFCAKIQNDYGIRFSPNQLPVLASDHIRIQNVVADFDNSLIVIWARIQTQLAVQNPPTTPAEIRLWLRNPDHAALLAQVRQLDLRSTNLKLLAPEIGNLKGLETLILAKNQLEELPDEIGELVALKTLYLEANQFQQFPACIFKLSNLEILYLSQNPLEEIPEELEQLVSLQKLIVTETRIWTLPIALVRLPKLTALLIGQNPIHFIPHEVLESNAPQICQRVQITEYKEELAYAAKSVYAKLYHAILRGDHSELLFQNFQQLSPGSKALIECLSARKYLTSKDVLEHRVSFGRAVREGIFKQLEQFSTDVQQAICALTFSNSLSEEPEEPLEAEDMRFFAIHHLPQMMDAIEIYTKQNS